MVYYVALLIPLFLLLISIEFRYSRKRKDDRYSVSNTVLNMAVGVIDQLGALFYMVLLYVAMDFSSKHFQIVKMPIDWKQGCLAFLVVDFISYWYHRFSHRVNFLWAGHVTHHSSSYYNFSNGFRTSPFQGLFRIPFWMVMPIFGFDPLLLLLVFKLSGLQDFLVHTSYVPKLGFLEKIFVTPSHHRVHHGKNDLYIDKNYGSCLIVWDKWFGTYQEETVVVEYGITSAYTDDNPMHAITYYFQLLWGQCRRTVGLRNKILVLIMPPGWFEVPKSEGFAVGMKTRPVVMDRQFQFYGLWLLFSGVFGFICTLYYHQVYPIYGVGYAFLLSVSCIVQSALLINRGPQQDFQFWEKLRLWGLFLLAGVLSITEPFFGIVFLTWLLPTGLIFYRIVPASN